MEHGNGLGQIVTRHAGAKHAFEVAAVAFVLVWVPIGVLAGPMGVREPVVTCGVPSGRN